MSNDSIIPISADGYTQIPCIASAERKPTSSALQAIFLKSKIWTPGSKGDITITFGSTSCSGCSTDASWALVGSDAVGKPSPTVCLGFIDPPWELFTFNGVNYPYELFKDATRNYCDNGKKSCKPGWTSMTTIIHEACHFLGSMVHEHQNNLFKSNKIKLNRDAVISYYTSVGMQVSDAENNVLKMYDCADPENCEYIGSVFDPDSIMLYALPDSWVDSPVNPTKPNFVLSKLDKEWLSKMYPKDVNYPQITIRFIDEDSPPWKEALVQKAILENLFPIMGMGLRFIGKDGKSVTAVPDTIYRTPRPALDAGPTNPPSIQPNTKTPIGSLTPSIAAETPSIATAIGGLQNLRREGFEEEPEEEDVETFNSKSKDPVIIALITIICILFIFLIIYY